MNELAEELRLQAERNRSEQAIKFLGLLAEDLKIQNDKKGTSVDTQFKLVENHKKVKLLIQENHSFY